MMALSPLAAEERACLQSFLPGGMLHGFARRLEQRLLASLGVQANAVVSPLRDGGDTGGDEPVIRIAPELADAWLALRLGGKPSGVSMPGDERLAVPFKTLIRRTLAESAVNAGKEEWPQAMRLELFLGGRQGTVEIFWNGARALEWARRAIREKT
ncbi:MAG: hypothetical protein AB1591_12345 [Pseudomonadota bacterium]